jgi:4a-hydroxytetrahydrobiopterin dehydratase
MTDLSKKKCMPCKAGGHPLKDEALKAFMEQIDKGWILIHGDERLEKIYAFKNFRDALDFTIRIGHIAEEEQHHPDITLSWGKVKATLWTHKIKGLSEADFILAAKFDTCFEEKKTA